MANRALTGGSELQARRGYAAFDLSMVCVGSLQLAPVMLGSLPPAPFYLSPPEFLEWKRFCKTCLVVNEKCRLFSPENTQDVRSFSLPNTHIKESAGSEFTNGHVVPIRQYVESEQTLPSAWGGGLKDCNSVESFQEVAWSLDCKGGCLFERFAPLCLGKPHPPSGLPPCEDVSRSQLFAGRV